MVGLRHPGCHRAVCAGGPWAQLYPLPLCQLVFRKPWIPGLFSFTPFRGYVLSAIIVPESVGSQTVINLLDGGVEGIRSF